MQNNQHEKQQLIQIVNEFKYITEEIRESIHKYIIPLFDECFIHVNTTRGINGFDLHFEFIEQHSGNSVKISTFNQSKFIFYNPLKKRRQYIKNPSNIPDYVRRCVPLINNELKQMEKELKAENDSLQQFIMKCESQNEKVEDFSNFEMKKKEYAQITFNNYMDQAENDNSRFDKEKVIQFLKETKIVKENGNRQRVEEYQQKEIEYVSIDISRSTKSISSSTGKKKLQESPARKIKPTLNSNKQSENKEDKESNIFEKLKGGMEQTIGSKEWERVRSIDTNTIVWKIELNEGFNLILDEIKYFQEMFCAVVDLFKKGIVSFEYVVKVMKDYKVFNKVFIETLVDCPLKEEHHYEINKWKKDEIIDKELYDKLVKQIRNGQQQ